MSDTTSLLIGVGLLAGNGFFVASEFAVLSAKRHRLEQAAADKGPLGRSAARSAVRGVRELSMMLAGAQLGITICTLGLLTVVEPALAHLLEPVLHAVHLPDWSLHPIAFLIALAVVTFLHMVVGEMAPKSWSLTHPETAAMVLALPFRGFTLVTRPLLVVLNGFTNWLLHRFGVDARDELGTTRTPGQLAMLVRESGKEGLIDPDEHQLLTRALRVQTLAVGTVMVPLDRAATVPARAGVERILAASRATGYLRLPVRDDDGAVLGVLHVRDAAGRPPDDPVTARELARPVPRLEATTVIPEAVERLAAARSHLGLIVDSGTVTGMVSQTDLVGQLL